MRWAYWTCTPKTTTRRLRRSWHGRRLPPLRALRPKWRKPHKWTLQAQLPLPVVGTTDRSPAVVRPVVGTTDRSQAVAVVSAGSAGSVGAAAK